MKGIIYARYSCDNQREESIEGQLLGRCRLLGNAFAKSRSDACY